MRSLLHWIWLRITFLRVTRVVKITTKSRLSLRIGTRSISLKPNTWSVWWRTSLWRRKESRRTSLSKFIERQEKRSKLPWNAFCWSNSSIILINSISWLEMKNKRQPIWSRFSVGVKRCTTHSKKLSVFWPFCIIERKRLPSLKNTWDCLHPELTPIIWRECMQQSSRLLQEYSRQSLC